MSLRGSKATEAISKGAGKNEIAALSPRPARGSLAMTKRGLQGRPLGRGEERSQIIFYVSHFFPMYLFDRKKHCTSCDRFIDHHTEVAPNPNATTRM